MKLTTLIFTILTLSTSAFAGVEKLSKSKLPSITLSKSDSLLIDKYLKEKKDQAEAVIVQMVCQKKRKQYHCKSMKMESPKK